jgi:hypothetical protein
MLHIIRILLSFVLPVFSLVKIVPQPLYAQPVMELIEVSLPVYVQMDIIKIQVTFV